MFKRKGVPSTQHIIEENTAGQLGELGHKRMIMDVKLWVENFTKPENNENRRVSTFVKSKC